MGELSFCIFRRIHARLPLACQVAYAFFSFTPVPQTDLKHFNPESSLGRAWMDGTISLRGLDGLPHPHSHGQPEEPQHNHRQTHAPTCTHARTQARPHTHTRARTYTHTNVHTTHTHACTHRRKHRDTRTQTHACPRMYASAHVHARPPARRPACAISVRGSLRRCLRLPILHILSPSAPH